MNIQTIISKLQDHGLTQSEIATVGGLSQGQISDLLRGRRKDTSHTNGKLIEEYARSVIPKAFQKIPQKRKAA
jgi:transcriptional regulator with XRE-family HTH domain